MQMREVLRMRWNGMQVRSLHRIVLLLLSLSFGLGWFGSEAVAQQPAHRIISTVPSVTEALFALGLGKQVVGVSQYCEWPAEVKQLPKVGSYVQPNVETIVRLRPDLVLLEQASGEAVNRLKTLGVRFVEVPHGSLADTYAGIVVIAKAAGVPDRGTVLVTKLQEELRAVAAKAQALPKVRVLVVVDRRQGTLTDLYAVGPGSFLNELVEAAGGINVLAKPGVPPWPKISLETVLREDPDVIVDLSDAHDTDAQHVQARIADGALWGREVGLRAARSGRIFIADSPVFVVPGPRCVEAAKKMFGYFHGSGARR